MTRAAAGLRATLRALRVGVVVGEPISGIDVRVAPRHLVDLLAGAHERLTPTVAARSLPGGVIEVGAGARRVVLGAGLDEPPRDAGVAAGHSWAEADAHAVAQLSAAARPIALVGPGVLRDGHVPGLRSLAIAGNLGVANTWGAKGVLHWRSRHHLATIGLQQHDFSMSGFHDADLIVTSGVDAQEAPHPMWAVAPVVDVPPAQLAATAEALRRPRDEIVLPPIRHALARVTVAGWESSAVPPAPSRLTQLYGQVLGDDGLVVADPGWAGFFVARTSGTTRPGGVVVPADDVNGFAVAASMMSWLAAPWRRCVAVIDHIDDITAELLEVAGTWGAPVVLDVWGGDERPDDADAHRDRLLRALASGARHVSRVRVDGSQMDDFVAVAGPPICWTESDWLHRHPA